MKFTISITGRKARKEIERLKALLQDRDKEIAIRIETVANQKAVTEKISNRFLELDNKFQESELHRNKLKEYNKNLDDLTNKLEADLLKLDTENKKLQNRIKKQQQPA